MTVAGMTDERGGREPEPVVEVARHRLRRRRRPDGRVAVALLVLLVWAGSTVADIVTTSYSPPEGLTTVALAAATFLFSSALRRENRDA